LKRCVVKDAWDAKIDKVFMFMMKTEKRQVFGKD